MYDKTTYWVFCEYEKKGDYPDKPFNTKKFFDFDEMKEYSAKRAKKNRLSCANYWSDYWKVQMIRKEE